jgi:hypothetical protein
MPTIRNSLASTKLLRTVHGPLIIPAPVTAEVDYYSSNGLGVGRGEISSPISRRTIYRCLSGA